MRTKTASWGRLGIRAGILSEGAGELKNSTPWKKMKTYDQVTER